MNKYAYFAIVVAVSLSLCLATFMLLAGKDMDGFVLNFIVNFPLGLIQCIISYTVINRLSQNCFLKRHTPLRIACDWLCTMAMGTVLSLASYYIIDTDGDWRKSLLTFYLWNSIVVMGIELYIYHRSVLETQERLAHAEKEKMAYLLETLKKQISPHFLFNSLTALASLTYQDAEKANLFTKKLSAVYRYILITADRQLVPLSDELRFLSSYLYLEDIRFGVALQTHLDIPDNLLSKSIVPTTLQLLVENAIKHNIATETRPLTIYITATDSKITVTNNYQPRTDVASNKKGLQNLSSQYAVFGRTISVNKSNESFAVSVPLL